MKFASRLKITTLVLATIGLTLMTSCLDNLDVTPPLVTILNPAPGEIVSGSIPIVVTASDDEEIEQINIFVNGESVHTATGNSTIFDWNSNTVTQNANHNISAFATDKNGNVGPSAITTVLASSTGATDVIAPLVTIINPLNGGDMRGNSVTIVADVIDDSDIDAVEFYFNGELETSLTDAPYSHTIDISNLADGSTHTIYVKATDMFGNSGAQLINAIKQP